MVERLAGLVPEVAATGHDIAMHGPALREQLLQLARKFDEVARPKIGRYVHTPATADASGVRSVPPPVATPWAKGLLVAGALASVALLVARGTQKKRRSAKSANKLQNPDRYAERARRQRPAD